VSFWPIGQNNPLKPTKEIKMKLALECKLYGIIRGKLPVPKDAKAFVKKPSGKR